MKRVISVIAVCVLCLVGYDRTGAASPRLPGEATSVPSASRIAVNPAQMSATERSVIAEMNRARANPRQYAEDLQKLRARFKGNIMIEDDGTRMQTQEGGAAVDDAIRFLQTQAPLSALAPSDGLAAAARDMVLSQGPTGATGHTAPDGSKPGARLARYGQFEITWGENIGYGYDNPKAIVAQLIIDDGVSNRGHRANIFNPQFKCVGVAIGPHAKYRHMCVMDFAGGFVDKPAR